MNVNFIKLSENAVVPKYQTRAAAAVDLHCTVSGEILPNERALIKTGLQLEMPDELEAQVRSRSGLAYKHGVMVLNGIGTIDADYTGEVMVILHNTGTDTFIFNEGDRVAQLAFAKVLRPRLLSGGKEVVHNDAVRDGGFGSTGTK